MYYEYPPQGGMKYVVFAYKFGYIHVFIQKYIGLSRQLLLIMKSKAEIGGVELNSGE